MCKGGRMLCGNKSCPLLAKTRIVPKIQKTGKQFFGPSYSIFVGRVGYPRINIGPLAAVDVKPNLDNPKEWFGMDYSGVIELRSSMLRTKQSESVFSRSKFITENQELALASRPTHVEMKFKKNPVYRFSFSDIFQPMGTSASLEKMKLTENPKIRGQVEKIVSDELKAAEAGFMLYNRGEDVYKVTTILSSGALGMQARKKLVPTRWSITASQTMIADKLIEQIKQYPSINEYRVYSSQYLDNHFEVVLMPGNWEFENFEAWAPGSFWSQNLKETEILEEYEPHEGRTKYAELQGGGFYSSRFGVVEGLSKIRRQARVVVFREVYEGYVIPVGCWQIVENVRNAFRKKYLKFDTKEEALKYIDSRLRLPIDKYIKRSKMLLQSRLTDFSKFI